MCAEDAMPAGDYRTVLELTVSRKDADFASILLACGADPKLDTSLQEACYNGDNAIVTLLLDRGADVTTQGKENLQPMS
jgi:ankyrin repeat protein